MGMIDGEIKTLTPEEAEKAMAERDADQTINWLTSFSERKMKTLRRVRYRRGRCYELALKIMLYEPGAERFTLVHGRISQLKGDDDYMIDHAWVELEDGTIYDPVRDKCVPADVYVSLWSAEAERRYSREDTMRVTAATGHSGPWHRPPS